ncbi:azurin [Lysobacter sp. CW239]|uniref:azurin n=1 Tax=Lysobacteraceae TaxID=32033 RepID=UPI00056728F3|nr:MULTISPECIES: azurin [Lysobacter]QOD90433.1 azurin [Lysobacter sp. CW239]
MLRTLAVALALSLAAPAAFAATCSVDLEGNDAMQFNKKEIVVSKSCKTFTINLKHPGKLARNVMGHNVVIARTADIKGIDADGMKAGLAADYIKPGDTRVVAHSKVIGAGESTSVSFNPAKLSADPNSFFCSFPGHSAMMKGTLKLVP